MRSPFRIAEGDCVKSAKVLGIDPVGWGDSIEEARANGWTREDRVYVYPDQSDIPILHWSMGWKWAGEDKNSEGMRRPFPFHTSM